MSDTSPGGGGADGETGGRSGPKGRPSVLIIEPTEPTRRLMEQALRPDYRVDAVATYEQARRHVGETHYDGIILSVYQRDVEAGLELMTSLRGALSREEGPVILVGRAPPGRDDPSLRDAGVDDVLRMPFTESELLDVVGRHLR
jgi:DNA-binding response OmpR family regulator